MSICESLLDGALAEHFVRGAEVDEHSCDACLCLLPWALIACFCQNRACYLGHRCWPVRLLDVLEYEENNRDISLPVIMLPMHLIVFKTVKEVSEGSAGGKALKSRLQFRRIEGLAEATGMGNEGDF